MYNIAIYTLEDEEFDREEIKGIIEEEKVVNFKFFHTGQELLEIMSGEIHVVILDETLPGSMSGYEVLLAVKKKNPSSFTIGYSATMDYKVVLKYWKSGCDVWVDKNDMVNRRKELKQCIHTGLQEAKYRMDAIKDLTDDKMKSNNDRR